MKRRNFLKITLPILGVGAKPLMAQEKKAELPEITFGVIADPQYADADARGSRFYRNSLKKLDSAIAELNKHELKFTVTLGDVIDRDFKSFADIMPIYKKAKAPQTYVLGNHDFDAGIDGLLKQLPHANFPFLNVNYSFEDTILYSKIKKFKIFEKDKLKIGVFGVGIELDGLVPEKLYQGVKYSDPIQAANFTAKLLKEEKKCDYIICLSHLGFKYNSEKVSDYKLAQNSRNIDLILGGHTHTFLEEPVKVNNLDNAVVAINQVGWAGIQLGRLEVFFEKKNKKNEVQNFKSLNLLNPVLGTNIFSFEKCTVKNIFFDFCKNTIHCIFRLLVIFTQLCVVFNAMVSKCIQLFVNTTNGFCINFLFFIVVNS